MVLNFRDNFNLSFFFRIKTLNYFHSPKSTSLSSGYGEAVVQTCTVTWSVLNAGPYYPLGTIGTVPTAYDIFRAYEGMEGTNIKINKL
jgi:hypothetical protein